MDNEINSFLKPNFRGQDRAFGIQKPMTVGAIFYVIGKNRTGKQTMIQK